jgi:hypothetical protein
MEARFTSESPSINNGGAFHESPSIINGSAFHESPSIIGSTGNCVEKVCMFFHRVAVFL